jgi:hypothetical protein
LIDLFLRIISEAGYSIPVSARPRLSEQTMETDFQIVQNYFAAHDLRKLEIKAIFRRTGA